MADDPTSSIVGNTIALAGAGVMLYGAKKLIDKTSEMGNVKKSKSTDDIVRKILG
jgi:hypothetical protein